MTTDVPAPTLALDEAFAFLQAVYGEADHGFIHLWSLSADGAQKETTWLDLAASGLGVDVARAIQRRPDANWYISTSIGPANKGPHQRLLSAEAIGVTALTADLDIADPAHAKQNLPPTIEAALDVLDELELPPSILIQSGHGLQAWWLLREPLYFDTPQEKTEFETLSRNWQSTIRFAFYQRGWTVDSTHDLARVLRLPGTLNAKQQKDGTPLPVVPARLFFRNAPVAPINENLSDLLQNVTRYNPSDFLDRFPLDIGTGMGPLPERAAAYVAADGLVLDPAADPPREAHETLLMNSRQYRATWDRKRVFPSGDQSASVYDLALAVLTAKAGFTDQEIVDTCIAWRRKYGEDDPKKIARHDYWQKYVLGKVRARIPLPEVDSAAAARDAKDQVREENIRIEMGHGGLQRAWWSAATSAQKDEVRQKLLDLLSSDYGIEIEDISKILGDEPQYQATINGVVVGIGTAKILQSNTGQSGLRAAILDFHPSRRDVRLFDKEVWPTVRQSIVLAAREIDPGGESTKAGQALTWLTRYLTEKFPFAENAQKGAEGGFAPFKDGEGRICIFSAAFATSVTTFLSPGTKRPFVFECLRAFGCEPPRRETLKSAKGSRSNYDVYVLPMSPVVPIDAEKNG